jgi:hypothetical protein
MPMPLISTSTSPGINFEGIGALGAPPRQVFIGAVVPTALAAVPMTATIFPS